MTAGFPLMNGAGNLPFQGQFFADCVRADHLNAQHSRRVRPGQRQCKPTVGAFLLGKNFAVPFRRHTVSKGRSAAGNRGGKGQRVSREIRRIQPGEFSRQGGGHRNGTADGNRARALRRKGNLIFPGLAGNPANLPGVGGQFAAGHGASRGVGDAITQFPGVFRMKAPFHLPPHMGQGVRGAEKSDGRPGRGGYLRGRSLRQWGFLWFRRDRGFRRDRRFRRDRGFRLGGFRDRGLRNFRRCFRFRGNLRPDGRGRLGGQRRFLRRAGQRQAQHRQRQCAADHPFASIHGKNASFRQMHSLAVSFYRQPQEAVNAETGQLCEFDEGGGPRVPYSAASCLVSSAMISRKNRQVSLSG